MKKIFYLCLLSFISFQLFTSCQISSNRTDNITISDSGKTFYIQKGKSFYVKLDSYPEAGYMWDILPYNERIIKFIDSKFKNGTKKNIGLSGERTIKFEALSQGETTLSLIYYKVWEKNRTPIKKINVRLVIK